MIATSKARAWRRSGGDASRPLVGTRRISTTFTGVMAGRLWFRELRVGLGGGGPEYYSKAPSEPLTDAEQEAIIAAEQQGLARLGPLHAPREAANSVGSAISAGQCDTRGVSSV